MRTNGSVKPDRVNLFGNEEKGCGFRGSDVLKGDVEISGGVTLRMVEGPTGNGRIFVLRPERTSE